MTLTSRISSSPDHRRAELVASTAHVRAELADACVAAGRDPRSVTLVAVTKTFPVEDAATLVQLGQLDLGENRDQDARSKAAELPAALSALGAAGDHRGTGEVRWHFVGQLQSNKARSVVRYAHAVHSVDRIELVARLASAAGAEQRPAPLSVFVQLDLSGAAEAAPSGRGGASPADLLRVADEVAASSSLHLAGVMTVAPRGVDPAGVFATLAELSARLRAQHPGAASISAGMSQDFPEAIRHGATHVRIGSALLGRRSPVVG